MKRDEFGLPQSPAQAAEGDGLAERLRIEAECDVLETARDGTFERLDAERWAAIMYEAADEIDRLRALSADAAATIAAARKQAAEEMRERAANTAELIGQGYESAWRQDRKADPYLQGCADTADEVATAIRALPPSSSPEDQQKAAATPTIADPDGEARS